MPSNSKLPVPELTRSADIKLNERVSLRRHSHALSVPHRTFFPKSGPTVAKPSGDHTALGGFVHRQTAQRRYASLLDDCKLFGRDYARHDRLDLAYRLDRASTYLIRSRWLGQQQIAYECQAGCPKHRQPEDRRFYRAHARPCVMVDS
jgi:hypothetical protein